MVIEMNEELWLDLKKVEDPNNKYSTCYLYPTGDKFYVEPVFLLKLSGMKQYFSDRFDEIILEMERIVKKNHLVVFIGEEEEEITNVDGAVYLTIQDVCNPLKIYPEDKSRGSDYGD